jgi:hypothetical protein
VELSSPSPQLVTEEHEPTVSLRFSRVDVEVETALPLLLLLLLLPPWLSSARSLQKADVSVGEDLLLLLLLLLPLLLALELDLELGETGISDGALLVALPLPDVPTEDDDAPRARVAAAAPFFMCLRLLVVTLGEWNTSAYGRGSGRCKLKECAMPEG